MIGFFEESENNKSINRLITFIWAIYSIVLSFFVYLSSKDATSAIIVFTSIATVAASTKLIQKGMENKNNNNQTPQ